MNHIYLLAFLACSTTQPIMTMVQKQQEIIEEEEFDEDDFYYAIDGGEEEYVIHMIAEGIDINMDGGGLTPLAAAAGAGQKKIVALFLAAKAQVNKQTYCEGFNSKIIRQWALQCAYAVESQEIFDMLLKAGADVDLLDESGKTLLMRAAKYGYKEIVEKLLNAGAQINMKDKKRRSALMHAVKESPAEIHKEITARLSGYGFYAIPDNTDIPALMRKALQSRKDIIDLLLHHGAYIYLIDNQGKTAIDIAREHGNPQFANYIASQRSLKELASSRVAELLYKKEASLDTLPEDLHAIVIEQLPIYRAAKTTVELPAVMRKRVDEQLSEMLQKTRISN